MAKWSPGTHSNSTVHAVLESTDKLDEVINGIKEAAKREGISHSTIEGETHECHCPDAVLLAED